MLGQRQWLDRGSGCNVDSVVSFMHMYNHVRVQVYAYLLFVKHSTYAHIHVRVNMCI